MAKRRRHGLGWARPLHHSYVELRVNDAAESLAAAKASLRNGYCGEALQHLLDAERMRGSAAAHSGASGNVLLKALRNLGIAASKIKSGIQRCYGRVG